MLINQSIRIARTFSFTCDWRFM